jgi:hypothetical protein
VRRGTETGGIDGLRGNHFEHGNVPNRWSGL